MNAATRVRIGAVSYLNTKPLVCGLEQLAPQADVLFDLPSRLADQLADRQLDVALIPSIEYLQDPSYVIISDACIACRGPVWSVKLFSRTPITHIRRLALDEGSRTSVALTRILLARRHNVHPDLETLPIGATLADTSADAVLLIGDRAIHEPRESFAEVWDLGEEWQRWTGWSFVFAMWVARRDEVPDGLAEALSAARDLGLTQLETIAQHEAPRMRLAPEACLSYLRDNLYFTLGPREQQGLNLFKKYAIELGLAPALAST